MTWLPPTRVWRSGRWSLELRDDGELADLAFDGRVALRSVRAVIRDRHWRTVALIVDRVRETDSTLTLHVRSSGADSSFRGVVRAEARASGLLVIVDLESDADFWTNRTGVVVLHPPALAGAEVMVTHPDGRTGSAEFPREISPHQPALDIAGLAWDHDGLRVDVSLEGDVFEMEDQRNWSDASFKTYSRPLARPIPYLIAAGERVIQSVAVQVAPSDPAPRSVTDADVIRLVAGGTFPAIGLGAATAPDPAPAFTAVGSSVLVELDLQTANWRAALRRAATVGLPLDVRLVAEPGRPDLLDEAARALAGFDVMRVGAFDASGEARHTSPARTVAALRTALARAGLSAEVLGGTRSHFTELNREHHRLPEDAGALDVLTVTVTPLFHELGTHQLVESIAIQRLIARQTVELADGIPVHVGPIALRPRFDDEAAARPLPPREDLADGYGGGFADGSDPRQSMPELAAWTVASAAALGIPGVGSLTYFEEWGERGVRTADGRPLPAHDALVALAALAARGGILLSGESPDGLVWAIGVAGPDGHEAVLMVNLDRRHRTITVSTPAGDHTASLPAFAFTSLAPSGPAARHTGGDEPPPVR